MKEKNILIRSFIRNPDKTRATRNRDSGLSDRRRMVCPFPVIFRSDCRNSGSAAGSFCRSCRPDHRAADRRFSPVSGRQKRRKKRKKIHGILCSFLWTGRFLFFCCSQSHSAGRLARISDKRKFRSDIRNDPRNVRFRSSRCSRTYIPDRTDRED